MTGKTNLNLNKCYRWLNVGAENLGVYLIVIISNLTCNKRLLSSTLYTDGNITYI